MTRKVVLEIDDADLAFLKEGLDKLRSEAKGGRLNISQKNKRINRIHALESHVDDSWESAGKLADWWKD